VATKRSLILERLAIVILGVYLAGSGIATLATGRATHPNYLHAPTSAAMAVAIGSVLIVLGTFGWNWLSAHL
jgi:hypothetical protein